MSAPRTASPVRVLRERRRGLIEQLNPAEWWPNRWADYVFAQDSGDDGLDFYAPEVIDVPTDQ